MQRMGCKAIKSCKRAQPADTARILRAKKNKISIRSDHSSPENQEADSKSHRCNQQGCTAYDECNTNMLGWHQTNQNTMCIVVCCAAAADARQCRLKARQWRW